MEMDPEGGFKRKRVTARRIRRTRMRKEEEDERGKKRTNDDETEPMWD